jgi:hypothetical protein
MIRKEEVRMVLDPYIVKMYVVDSLKESEDKFVRDLYQHLLVSGGEDTKVSAKELLAKMRHAMKRHEEDARVNHDLSDDLDSSDRQARNKKKKKAKALKMNASERSDILGVCLEHQTGKCRRGKACHFSHDKLNKADHEKLKQAIKLRKEQKGKEGGERDLSSLTCYSCGEKGHISTTCPDKKAVVKRVELDSNGKTNWPAALKQATAGMSQEQIQVFAQALIKSSSEQAPAKE